MEAWWKKRVVYQIYPKSFCDSNGDGIGDIPGIISKLDYLSDLGIGIIWLSPVYCSPNKDNGYDISNYTDINPEYGTLSDMQNLLSEAKKRDIKIIMDLVINHTSDQHPWFQESKKDLNSPYRDYYIWQKAKNGKTPNNWSSFFTGTIWEWDEHTSEYYLHLFAKEQPDLNWKNPKIKEEIKKILEFWFDMGIDGFRCDVINVIYKTCLADGKRRIALTGLEHYHSQEGCHKILQELNQEVFSKHDCFTVGETVLVDTKMANDLCDPQRKELNMVFGFEHMDADSINNKWFKIPFKPSKFTAVLSKWQSQVKWNANYLENHDQPRSISRYGDDKENRVVSGKMLATLLLTLRGTPFIYQGQEIGMTNGDFENLDQMKDVESHNVFALATKTLHFPKKVAWKMILKTSRDNARTPMQWSSQINGGFTTGKPWLQVNTNYTDINVEKELSNPNSILSYYKELIKIRKNNSTLLEGSFFRIPSSKELFVYERALENQRCIIVLNFTNKIVSLPENVLKQIENNTIISHNYPNPKGPIDKLLPYEAFIFSL